MIDHEIESPVANIGTFLGLIFGGIFFGGVGVLIGGFSGMFLGILVDTFFSEKIPIPIEAKQTPVATDSLSETQNSES